MSSVVRTVKRTAKSVTKAVSKPIKWVGDTVEDVGEWAVEAIDDVIVEPLEDAYKAIEEDPIRQIAYIAAAASGQAWALPLVAGADTAIQGGDIGDVLEASAKAYVVGEVSAGIGKMVDAQFAPAAAPTASSTAASASSVNPAFGVTARKVATQATSDIAGDVVQDAVTSQIEQITKQITKNFVENTLTNMFFPDDDVPEKLKDDVENLMGTEQDAQYYGDPEERPVVMDDRLNQSVEGVNESYKNAQAKADELDQLNSDYREKASEYNKYADTLDEKITTQNDLKAEVDNLQETLKNTTEQGAYATAVNNYNTKVREYNESVKDAQSYYDENFAEDASATNLRTELESDFGKIQTASNEYQELKGDLIAKGDELGVNVEKSS